MQEITHDAAHRLTPIAAVTAPEPYAYYARLARERPFAFDEALGTWVAASATAVEAVLNHAALRVRPAGEPVPRAMTGTPLGEIFARMARMNDGSRHAELKCIAGTLAARWDGGPSALARALALDLARALQNANDLTRYLHAVPASLVACLAGVSPEQETLSAIADFARALAPGADVEQIELGSLAADRLKRAFPQSYGDDELANAIAFFFQSYDGIAGLIGAVLASLAHDGELASRAANEPAVLEGLLESIARYDPPLHNTRRFAASGVEIAGEAVRAGDAVLVLLAAANHDPAARGSYSFGSGPHACAGASVARAIALAGVQAVLACGFDLGSVSKAGYRPSQNARVPVFAAKGARA